MSSDPRQRYERMNKDQLIEVAITQHRNRQTDRHHIAALKQQVERANQLLPISIARIDLELGAPVLRDLIWTLVDVIESSHPLSSTPAENTMRVTNPSSSKDEGAPTRRIRHLMKALPRRVQRLTDNIRNDLERDEWSDHLSFVRRQTALTRWHRDGKHGDPVDDCPECAAA